MAAGWPRSVVWIRILLFAIAGLTFVMSAAVFVALGASARDFGYVLGASVPGVLQLLLGLFVRRGGRAVFYGILATQVLFIGYSLLTLGGDGRLSQIILPGVILVLLSRPSARDFFLRG